jgi:tripartite-type tricarboxylate transporter receptor subunit TctC
MILNSILRWVLPLGAVVGAASPTFAPAQQYPVKPVRLIVPYPPGGATDIFARVLGAKLGESFNHQVVVENRAGAAGVIGAELAARAAPDGYTLVVGQASNFAINQHLMGKLPYDPLRDFTPITLIAASPNLLVVHPSLPVRSIKDLVALAKSKPGAIIYASSGNGSPGHLATEYFKKVAGIDLVHVPYKGASPALMDVIAGQASLYFTSPIAAQPHVQSGRLRQIAVTSAQRFPPLPNVPTVAEAGYKEIDVTSWWGLLGPAGLSAVIVTRLQAETVKALNTTDTKDRLAAQGAAVATNTPEQFAAYIKSEIAKWGRIVRESGARLD